MLNFIFVQVLFVRGHVKLAENYMKYSSSPEQVGLLEAAL
jgi:hypothetical protein